MIDLSLATPEEAERYRQLLEQELASRSPLDLATLVWPETRRWPHLELLNEYLVALTEYRLTARGPAEPDTVRWWYKESHSSPRRYVKTPNRIPEDVDEYGGVVKDPSGILDGEEVVFNLTISMMPRAGKSRLTTEAFPLWCRLQDANALIGVGTYSDEFAASWGAGARDTCISLAEKLPWLPQPAGGPRAPQAIFSDSRGNGITWYVGTGGGINGKSLHVLVGDDFLKNDIDAQSEATRTGVNRFLDTVWMKRKTRDLRPGARFPIPISVTMGTRWHRLDPIGHLSEDPETGLRKKGWCCLNIPALCVDPESDPLGREEGAGFPNAAGLTRAALEEMRADDPRTFAALYQGSPRPEKGGLVSADFKQYWEKQDGDEVHMMYRQEDDVVRVPLSECLVFAAADMAATKRTTSDYTVVGIFAHHRPSGITFIREWYRKRLTTDEYVEHIVPLFERHNVRRIAIENVSYGQMFGQQLERLRYGVDFYPSSMDKVSRAASSDVSRLIRTGRLRLPVQADFANLLITEVGDFPYGANDDQVDVLSASGWFLQEQVPALRPQQERKVLTLQEEIDAHAERAAKRRGRSRNRDPWSALARRG